MKETGRQMKETDKRMGFLQNRFGELAEHLVGPNIYSRFNELGYHFSQMATKGCLYVIEQSGDTMKIDVPDGFVPKNW